MQLLQEANQQVRALAIGIDIVSPHFSPEYSPTFPKRTEVENRRGQTALALMAIPIADLHVSSP